MGSSKKGRDHLAEGKAIPREFELKLELAPGDVRRLLDHPLIAGAEPDPSQSGHLSAVYFDTPDLDLQRSGISLRIRRRNGRSIQTIKAEDRSRGLALDRGEWEKPVDGELDFGAAADTPLAPLVSSAASREAIRPAFTIETERLAFTAERGEAVIELALDEATAAANGKSVHFAELELELKQGDPASLFALACDLAKATPLRLAPITKSERGYGLLGQTASGPVRARSLEIDSDASCAEAFQIIARSCLSQMIANEAILRRTQDPETVHQMRVGLRRLRAAMSLFKAMLAGRQTETVKSGLRWIGKKLGPARDLDVLLGHLRGTTGSGLTGNALDDTERRRRKAYDALLKALDSPRYTSAILETAAWIEAGGWLETGDGRSRPVRKHAVKELSRRHRRILREARDLEDMGDDERHELRIRIKKMRYGTEFFASLFQGKKAKKRRKAMLSVLERLQDHLGEMNDIAVGGTLIPSPSPTEQSPEDGPPRMQELLPKAVAVSHKLLKAKPFWS